MRKTLFLFAFLGFWTQTFAQQHDKLVIGNDTTKCQLKTAYKKGQIVVSSRKTRQARWNEISAENADAAIISDQSLFMSLKLPDVPKKVWAKCFFDGTYKLLEYRGEFYIVEPEKITKLWYRIVETGVGKNSKFKFNRQMILIFYDKMDYNFGPLKYDSKSLVQPLIRYHEINHLPYRDYNHYIEVKSNWNISGGLSQENYKLSTQVVKSVNMAGYAPFIAANLNSYFPQLSNRLFYSVGIEVSNPKIDALNIQSMNGHTVYFNLSYKRMSLMAPVRIGYKLIQNPKIAVSLQTGIKVLKGFSSGPSLRIETEKDNIVRTELATVESYSAFELFHCSELLVGIPNLSKSISVGASYDYSLSNKNQEKKIQENNKNTVSLDHSLLIFARFTF